MQHPKSNVSDDITPGSHIPLHKRQCDNMSVIYNDILFHCRQSDDYVKKCYHGIMIQLMKEHAEIRISSVQLVDVLFNRSHCFRELLLADFKDFMELTIGCGFINIVTGCKM